MWIFARHAARDLRFAVCRNLKLIFFVIGSVGRRRSRTDLMNRVNWANTCADAAVMTGFSINCVLSDAVKNTSSWTDIHAITARRAGREDLMAHLLPLPFTRLNAIERAASEMPNCSSLAMSSALRPAFPAFARVMAVDRIKASS